MSYPVVLGRRSRAPMFVFKRALLQCSISLDERAPVALDALVARTGDTGTATMRRILARGARTSRSVRDALVAEYRRCFGGLPPGRTIDIPGRWTPEVKRAYQNEYAVAHRAARAQARPGEDHAEVLARAQREGQIAGRRAAKRAAQARSLLSPRA